MEKISPNTVLKEPKASDAATQGEGGPSQLCFEARMRMRSQQHHLRGARA